MSGQVAADLRAAAKELRSLGRDLLSANYEGPDGGPPSEQGWPHFDCEDILGEYVIKRAAALEAAADAAEATP
ncbi:MAG: hypothetical protein JWO98_4901 [Frankiales bacterium]|nr:hypothetical protein [Frankiales bacterium]